MNNAHNAYQQLLTELRGVAVMTSTESMLQWDQETQMPPAAAEWRGEQLALLSSMSHERLTSPRIGELLSACEAASDLTADPHSPSAADIRETRRQYDRARKLPSSLVGEMSRQGVIAHTAWTAARKADDFSAFAPHLSRWIELKRQEIACHGIPPGGEMYDVLLEDYEPGETTANLRRVFDTLRKPLVDLVGRIVSSGRTAPLDLLERNYPADGQEKMCRFAAAAIGFDFAAGRLDTSVHPFCSQTGPRDVRMTTRYDPNYFGDAFFGVLHETGHALYDLGLPADRYGLPSGSYISLGIHESQSRMWENLVGRSKAFWQHLLPRLKEVFPGVTADIELDRWYFAVNDVRPSLIRTEADEATYNLHIMLRFELEPLLLSGDLPVNDLPAAWNQRVKSYLGLDVPSSVKGCLQDVHWSHGSFGYFPTYTLGNLYAAQFFERARADLVDLEQQFARGEFAPLLAWLVKNIHSVGRRYTAPQLVEKVTGRPLSAEPLLNYLRGKAAELYGV